MTAKLESLQRLPERAKDDVKSWLRETEKKIRADAPVRTGKLRDSVKTTNDSIEAQAPYAGFVEWGTRYNKAQPFFFKNIDTKRLAKLIRKRIRNILRRK